MWGPYAAVFLGALLFDVVPFPFLPAFTIMLYLQLSYGLNVWVVLFIGVSGSILGRYLLTLYIPHLSGRFFKPEKNEDVRFLGEKLKQGGWQSQAVIVAYSLLPLPTTPLFLASGMARIAPGFIIPAFFVGKLASDCAALSMGKYASQNLASLRSSLFSWQTIAGLGISLLLLLALLFIDWRALIQRKAVVLNVHIFK
jgi:membrane protein YqaA with SNARE-associated domain